MIDLLRKNSDLRALFFAQVISFMGDWFSFVAITGLVHEATDSSFLVSLAYVAFTLPSFLVTPVAGPVADRFDRRKILLVVSVLQAVAALGLLTASGSVVWPLFVFQGIISALAAFVKPAIDAGIPNLARTPEELRTANALFGSTWGVMLAVGAALGGVFSEVFGRDAAFLADAASFVVALGLFALIRHPMQEANGAHRRSMKPLADMKEAVHYARTDRVVMALIASKSVFAIGSGVMGLLPVLATTVFGWKDGGTGMLLGARGVGAGLGPFIAARFTTGDMKKVLLVCGWSGLWLTGCFVGAAWAPSIFIAALLIAIALLGGGAQWTLSTYGLQVSTPDHIRGRVMAGDFAIVTLVMGIVGLVSGVVSEGTGVQWTMTIFCGAGAIAGAGYIAWTRSIIRDLRAEPAPTPAA